MPTLIGADTVSSLSRHIVLPTITDQAYGSSPLFFRLNSANKKMFEGGTHIEAPMLYQAWQNGGAYQGFELLDTTPNDNIKSGGWDMKQYYVPVSIDGRTLARCNTSMAVANVLTTQWDQARMAMADILGTAVHGSAVSTTKAIDGLTDVVDAGGTATSYAGLVRSTNTWLNANLDASTATLTMLSLRNLLSSCTKGGHQPTLFLSRKEQYNRAWTLYQTAQRFVAGEVAVDGNGGFRAIYVENVPWIIDDKVIDGPNSSNSRIVALNEEVFTLALFASTDFEIEDFRKPVNQDAMVGFLKWWGNLICLAPQLQGAMTNVSA